MTAPQHTCPGPGCEARVPIDQLACRRHWYQVPSGLRRTVWRTFHSDAGGPTHRAAIEAAIAEMRP